MKPLSKNGFQYLDKNQPKCVNIWKWSEVANQPFFYWITELKFFPVSIVKSYNENDLLPFFIFIFKYIFLACL